MNSRSGFDDDERPEHDDGSPAVRRAGAGAVAWRAALDAHRQAADIDHQDFYGLTRELVATLGPITSLTRLLSTQVAGYAASLPQGRRVYDDTRETDPRDLLTQGAQVLADISTKLGWVALELHRFWSLIGRIGVEAVEAAPGDATTPPEETPDAAAGVQP